MTTTKTQRRRRRRRFQPSWNCHQRTIGGGDWSKSPPERNLNGTRRIGGRGDIDWRIRKKKTTKRRRTNQSALSSHIDDVWNCTLSCRLSNFCSFTLEPSDEEDLFLRNTNFFGFISSRLGTIQWYVPRVNWYLFVLGFAFNSGLINFVLFFVLLSCYFRVTFVLIFVINSLVHSFVILIHSLVHWISL